MQPEETLAKALARERKKRRGLLVSEGYLCDYRKQAGVIWEREDRYCASWIH